MRHSIHIRFNPMVSENFLIAGAVFKIPTRNGYNAQSVNLNLRSVLEYAESKKKAAFYSYSV